MQTGITRYKTNEISFTIVCFLTHCGENASKVSPYENEEYSAKLVANSDVSMLFFSFRTSFIYLIHIDNEAALGKALQVMKSST